RLIQTLKVPFTLGFLAVPLIIIGLLLAIAAGVAFNSNKTHHDEFITTYSIQLVNTFLDG
ncbi:6536_t:CDS:2, partial [Gigaspora rosea]